MNLATRIGPRAGRAVACPSRPSGERSERRSEPSTRPLHTSAGSVHRTRSSSASALFADGGWRVLRRTTVYRSGRSCRRAPCKRRDAATTLDRCATRRVRPSVSGCGRGGAEHRRAASMASAAVKWRSASPDPSERGRASSEEVIRTSEHGPEAGVVHELAARRARATGRWRPRVPAGARGRDLRERKTAARPPVGSAPAQQRSAVTGEELLRTFDIAGVGARAASINIDRTVPKGVVCTSADEHRVGDDERTRS